MTDKTLDLVLEMLDAEVYTTRRVLKHRTCLSQAALTVAFEELLDIGEIESIYVKNVPKSGRAEVAYRKVCDESESD